MRKWSGKIRPSSVISSTPSGGRGGSATPADCIKRNGEDEDDSGCNVLGGRRLPQEVEAVFDAHDHQGPQDGVIDATAAAEEPGAADHAARHPPPPHSSPPH